MEGMRKNMRNQVGPSSVATSVEKKIKSKSSKKSVVEHRSTSQDIF